MFEYLGVQERCLLLLPKTHKNHDNTYSRFLSSSRALSSVTPLMRLPISLVISDSSLVSGIFSFMRLTLSHISFLCERSPVQVQSDTLKSTEGSLGRHTETPCDTLLIQLCFYTSLLPSSLVQIKPRMQIDVLYAMVNRCVLPSERENLCTLSNMNNFLNNVCLLNQFESMLRYSNVANGPQGGSLPD